jgi:hypothetical protein
LTLNRGKTFLKELFRAMGGFFVHGDLS